MEVREMASLGGKARAANMSKKDRKASSAAAIKARWDAYYEKHPEKLAAKKARESRKQTPKTA